MSFMTLQTMRTSLLTAFLLTGVAVVACGSSDDDDAGSSSGGCHGFVTPNDESTASAVLSLDCAFPATAA